MSAEYCSKCDNQFLTESDDYYVIPSECYKLICGVCINKQLKETQEKLNIAVEALELILENKPVETITNKDRNIMFNWQMGISVKARQALTKIKGE